MKSEAVNSELADGAAEGQRPSLDAVLTQLRPALAAFLLRKLHDPNDLHDALQETSLRAWSYAGRSELRAPVSLCFRIAQNVATDFARAMSRAPMIGQPEQMNQLAAEDPGPERSAAVMQELALVKQVIGGLPPGCRHVFLLSRSRGMSNAEIAASCGVSVKLVEKQISRALRELRERSRAWEGDPR